MIVAFVIDVFFAHSVLLFFLFSAVLWRIKANEHVAIELLLAVMPPIIVFCLLEILC